MLLVVLSKKILCRVLFKTIQITDYTQSSFVGFRTIIFIAIFFFNSTLLKLSILI